MSILKKLNNIKSIILGNVCCNCFEYYLLRHKTGEKKYHTYYCCQKIHLKNILIDTLGHWHTPIRKDYSCEHFRLRDFGGILIVKDY
jgi:hypothetical protein